MSMIEEQRRAQRNISWAPVGGVQPVVFVGRAGDKPVGIIEMRPTAGFRVTSCTGTVLGDFTTLDEGERAFASWLADSVG